MGELFASFSDIMFSLVIGYMGAIEFLYVMRHLYHWSFNHDANRNGEDDDNLVNIQQNLRRQLNEAANQENITGYNVMRDGISYKDGFRLDPYGHEGAQEQEKFEKKIAQEKSERYKQLEEEYAEQKKLKEQIEDDLRKAEEAYLQKMGYLISETKMDVHQTDIKKEQEALQIMMNTARDRENKEENQNEISMEFKKEPRFQRGEIELSKLPVNSDQMIQIPEDLKIKHGIGSEVRYVDSMEIPTQSGSDQVLQCTIEKSKELLDMGRNSPEMIEQIVHNDILDTESIESAPYVLLSIKPNLNDIDESKENIYAIENIDNEGNNDREGLILADQNSKNNVSEHNIVNIPQEQFVKETDIQNEIIEEIITQKDIDFSLKESPTLSSQNEETYTSNNKNMLMDSSLEASSTILVQNEKISSSDNPSFKQSPLLCEESDNTLSVESEVTNSGNDVSLRTDFKHTQSELMPKDVEQVILEDDDNVTPQLYTEDYLRSLDGIKNKKRERSLHRRAFKKQRSSGSSNSSMESRTSRDEELEVFTSLEEEEMKRIGENFQPIIYTAEPPIKSKGHQSHKSRKKNEVSSVQEESNSAEKTYIKTDENVPFEMSAFDNSISSKRDPEKESNYKETKEDSKDELNTSGALATSIKPKLKNQNSSYFTSTLIPKCLNSTIIPEETYATALTQYDMDSESLIDTHVPIMDSKSVSNAMVKNKPLNLLENSSITDSELTLQGDIVKEHHNGNVWNDLEDTDDDEFKFRSKMNKTGAIRKIPDDSHIGREAKFEKMRRRNAEFRRSGSRSRSPLNDEQLNELASIEMEAKEKQLQDIILDEISARTEILENSHQLFMDHIASNRRASDSVLLVQKPGIVIELQENIDTDLYVEPKDYHYLRNLPVHMEHPNENNAEDYIFVEEAFNSDEQDTHNTDIIIEENYKPKKQYKWRKNFKLHEENDEFNENIKQETILKTEDENEENVTEEEDVSSLRKPSLTIEKDNILEPSDNLLILTSPFVEVTSDEINNSFKTMKNFETQSSYVILNDGVSNSDANEEPVLKITNEEDVKNSEPITSVKEENGTEAASSDNKTPAKKQIKRLETFDMLKDGNFYPLF